jgi:hypothetical protein
MKKLLIIAGISGIAAAIAIYLASENDKNDDTNYITDADSKYVSDADIEAYDMRENTGPAEPVF